MLNVKFIKENILSSHTVPKSLVSSTVGWTSIYFLIKKFTKKEPEWSVRLVTIVHATVVTMLSILDWSYIKQWDIDKLGLVFIFWCTLITKIAYLLTNEVLLQDNVIPRTKNLFCV